MPSTGSLHFEELFATNSWGVASKLGSRLPTTFGCAGAVMGQAYNQTDVSPSGSTMHSCELHACYIGIHNSRWGLRLGLHP